ncbi:MAG: phosphatidylserine/phosphatidylglycerophosphate/cardiolipinsynthase-like protein [Streptosporangiaceae bacterium]|jgi:phosphatidylserine/phosphatidylglycerophosphate/cardiolipin synthase-like enzyme|nr:phosphatidylserine/phosphatidylglycerophosphate/cardiolipinsynthase-like protein [Streptosporangiaceae bacterium]
MTTPEMTAEMAPVTQDPQEWLLTQRERGNPATRLDDRHEGEVAWSTGNSVRPLVHGTAYFTELLAAVRGLRAGDLLMFTDWRGDPDELLADGVEVSEVLCHAARRGVIVKGLVWRSHLDRLQFSEAENRHLGEEIEAAGGECLLDMRVRPGGSHHQKFIVLRHIGRPELDVAYVGGIDLCRSRHDDAAHKGDPQAQPMAKVYGSRPPWHDAQVEIRGPAVGDVEAVFRERWEDPAPLTRNPAHRLRALLQREDTRPDPLPPQPPDPPHCGPHTVQLLRTYPRRWHGYSFAPDGERSIARSYHKVLNRARGLIYLEDQYLWSPQVAAPFAEALAANPGLHMIAVIPRFPDQDGRLSLPPNLLGHGLALDMLRRGGGDRVAVYGLENHEGTPVYVHAKVCVVDDAWACVGSDNFNLRSWTHDSELSCAVLDETPDPREPRFPGEPGRPARVYARDLRLGLNREHLDRPGTDEADTDLCDPRSLFKAFAASAAALDAWHDAGRHGPRPPGRLRAYRQPDLSRWTKAWATPLYRGVFDPDGRPRALRRAGAF